MDCKIAILSTLLVILLSGVPDQPEAQSSAPAATTASSAFRLIGTLEAGPLSGAVIEDAAGAQTFYRIQERLPDGARILRVRSDSVVIGLSDGTLAELFVSQGPAGSAVPYRPVPPDPPARDIRSTDQAPSQEGPPKRPRPRRLIEEK